ncbi:MAG: prolipoprotein diacylglyceryl transferase [Calditrichaeota bacterium]|nr:MAG: prolipoprotein diacylglyceryl transferase [Calditrichota bacterium]
MYPDLFKIGPITIHSFGVMAMLGFLIPTLIMRKEFSRQKINPDLANNIAVGAILGGFVGARLYFIIEHWSEFVLNPMAMIFSGAGLVWYGGLIGGVIGVLWVIHKSEYSVSKIGDTVAPLILLGYAIGRIGCQLAGDGDYGPPSNLPWAMAYPHGVVPTDVPVHPTPIYDFILSMIFFWLLWKFKKSSTITGQTMGAAFIAMGIERFITEFFRNTPKISSLGITHAQFISLLVIVSGVIILLRLRNSMQATLPSSAKRQEPSVVELKKGQK